MSGKPTVATVPPKCFKAGNSEQFSLRDDVYQFCENAIFYSDVILVLGRAHNCPTNMASVDEVAAHSPPYRVAGPSRLSFQKMNFSFADMVNIGKRFRRTRTQGALTCA
jgi:hypothetical protein